MEADVSQTDVFSLYVGGPESRV